MISWCGGRAAQQGGGRGAVGCNALWVSNDFHIDEDYAKRTQELLSEVGNLDFKSQAEESRQHINSWVEEKIKDKIKHLLATGYSHATTRTRTRTHATTLTV